MILLESLAQVRPALPGTVMALQAEVGWRLWVDVLADVATIVIAVALILVGIGVIVAALAARRLFKKVTPTVERLRVDVQPIIRHGTAVAENVNYVSTAVRGDVEALQQTVAAARKRVDRVSALAEERVNELNALLEVIQEEAEGLFIDTASTLRGVRAGTEALRRFREEEEEYGGPDRPDEEDEEFEIRVRRS